MPPPRLLADEMLGRLARYLRMMGCDTLYARGWTDEEIARRARTEDRVVLTRDRDLSRRVEKALLLTSSNVEDQVRATRTAFPEITADLRFDRCTVCNGSLERFEPGESEIGKPSIPWQRVDQGLTLFRCGECHHVFWEGSHTEAIRRRLRNWTAEATA